jgi:leukotriene-A4 hydrolase
LTRTHGSLVLVLLSALALACSGTAVERDPHSFSRPDEVVVRHLSLDLDVDFDNRRLHGTATLTIENLTGAKALWLDTWDLGVSSVDFGSDETTTHYRFVETTPFLGQSLMIDINPDTTTVRVHYSSSPGAEALQWLEPPQTAGKRHPFLLSQSQACLARTWIPLQDSPGVRMTYDATIRVPPGMMALMSAENPTEKSEDGVYTFSMPQPIPSYLLALAVGDVVFQSLGERTGIYAEPEVIERAAWEFADTQKMLEASEELYGAYRWGRYDMIVLPPSFPFGGMENPRLTFLTPTVLAGDRSQVALVAHELAHSWSGNLVTNATWNDFWLNEGFTSYFEYRIMEKLYGREHTEILWLIGRQGLQRMIELEEPADTYLRVDYSDRNPDNVPSIVYDKGALFLRLLEEHYGRIEWDVFLNDYFERYAFGTVTTDIFLADLRAEFGDNDPWLNAAIQAWVFGPGLPEDAPVIQAPALDNVEQWLQSWLDGGPLPAEQDWSSHEWMHFVRGLPRDLSLERMRELDDAYKLSETGNAEVLTEWLTLTLGSGYDPAFGSMETFVTGMGRAKFLIPLYRKLCETPEGCAQAMELYERAKPGYHPVAITAVDRVFEAAQGGGS